MTVFRANTDLATQVFSPTRVWAGPNQFSFDANDPIEIGEGLTLTGEDLTIVTPRIGDHSGAPGSSTIFTGPTQGPDEVFTGTLNLRNSTIDMYNNTITIVSATRSATQLNITFSDEGFATSLAGIGANVREIIYPNTPNTCLLYTSPSPRD